MSAAHPSVQKDLQKLLARDFAEQATGIVQRGKLGQFYLVSANDDPPPLTDEEARAHLEGTEFIAVPNAGAGSYREFFTRMGFVDVEVIDHTSSAGDWCFGVKRKDGVWTLAFQENRFPRHGFNYSLQPQHQAGTFEVLVNSVCS